MATGAGVLALVLAAGLSTTERVESELAVERARYAFSIGATRPFDEAHPRASFARRVAREEAEEELLRRVFGLEPTPEVLREEYERIEKTTKDVEQWRAIKAALGDDHHRVEGAFCRPLVVSRALRTRFAFDRRIHAEPHAEARRARFLFMTGGNPVGVRRVRLRADGAEDRGRTEALLAAAKAGSLAGQPPSEDPRDAPEAVSSEVAAVLDKELRRAGDVTTILEERHQFQVYRLVERARDALTADVVRIPKEDFESWFDRARLGRDPATASKEDAR